MFSSEQILEISGSMDQLELAIRFAINMAEMNTDDFSFQITKDGKFCLGWCSDDAWTKFQFDFDSHIVSEIVKQHLNKQEYENPYDWADGSTEPGFLIKQIPQLHSDEHEGIRHPFYGIISIEPFMNFYAK